jgi:hypothetical protein
MTDTIETTIPETKAASKAVAVLCSQLVQRIQQESEALAALALESDGLDPKDGWRLDIANATFVKQSA